MAPKRPDQDMGTVSKALSLLTLFSHARPTIGLSDVTRLSGLNKATAYRLLGELQTVIKPLGKLFSFLQGIGGSTILGTGEVALILDVPGLMKHAEASKAQALSVA